MLLPRLSHVFKIIFLGLTVAAITLYWKWETNLHTAFLNDTMGPAETMEPKRPNEIKEKTNQTDTQTRPFTIVTGASSNHFCTLRAWIVNLQVIYEEHEELNLERPTVIAYDLGLNQGEKTTLRLAEEAGLLSEARTFNYSAYPAFFDISKNAGQFAWKPAIVAEVARDYPGFVVWLDAGTIVTPEFFLKIRSWIDESDGFFSPSSQGNMPMYTHPGVYAYYNDDSGKYEWVRNCNAAILAFDTMQTQYLIDQWLECAMVKDCIAPPGSDLSNHRQDQTIITYLAARDKRYCNGFRYGHGMFPHQDDRCGDRVNAFETINGYLDDWLRKIKNNRD